MGKKMGNSNKHQMDLRLSLVSQMMHAMGDAVGQSDAIIASAKKFEDYINGFVPEPGLHAMNIKMPFGTIYAEISGVGFSLDVVDVHRIVRAIEESFSDTVSYSEEPTDGIVMKHTNINTGQMNRDNLTATEQAFQGVDNRETRSLSEQAQAARSLSAREAEGEVEKIEKAKEEYDKRLFLCRVIFSQGVSRALLTKNYGPQIDVDRIIERIVRVMNTGLDDPQ